MPIDELKKLQETLYELSDQLPNEDKCNSLEDEVCGDIANLTLTPEAAQKLFQI